MNPRYDVIKLPSSDNALLLPEAINDHGQIIAQMVVGSPFLEIGDTGDISFAINDSVPAPNAISEGIVSGENPSRTAVLIENDGKTLIHLGFFSPIALNNLGQIVGLSMTSDFSVNVDNLIEGNLPSSAFQRVTSQVVFWDGSEVRRLFDDTVDSRGASINEKSEIVGWTDEPFGEDFRKRNVKNRRGFLWSQGTVTLIDPPSGYRFDKINGVSDSGTIAAQVVSTRRRKGEYAKWACLLNGGEWQFLKHPPNYNGVSVIALNNNHQVLLMLNCMKFDEMIFQADWFLWDAGTFIPVALCGHGLNDAGEVVGFTDGEAGWNAALCKDSQVFDLNDCIAPATGWRLKRAEAINNRGQIVGTGTYEGTDQAFLLTPISL